MTEEKTGEKMRPSQDFEYKEHAYEKCTVDL